MNKEVVCIVRDALKPAPLVLRLTHVGISPQAISVLVPDWPAANPPAEDAGPGATGFSSGLKGGCMTDAVTEAAAADAAAAPPGLSGQRFGRLAGLGLLAIPGLGLFVAAGPIIAALSAATLDLARGRVAAALVTMGLPELEAQDCEARVVAGQGLLSVQTRGDVQARQVRMVLAAA